MDHEIAPLMQLSMPVRFLDNFIKEFWGTMMEKLIEFLLVLGAIAYEFIHFGPSWAIWREHAREALVPWVWVFSLVVIWHGLRSARSLIAVIRRETARIAVDGESNVLRPGGGRFAIPRESVQPPPYFRLKIWSTYFALVLTAVCCSWAIVPPQQPELSPYAYYRHITQEQSEDMKKALEAFRAAQIGIYTYTGNEEQVSYTKEISEVFHQAGWTIIPGRPIDKADAEWLGLDSGPLKHSGISIIVAEEVSPKSAVAAFVAAKIPHQVIRDLKNQASVFYSGGIDKSMPILFIGPREEPK